MICKDFEKLIHLYLDQKLDEQKRKEMEKHLSECQKCREKFETLKLVEEKAKGIKIPEPGEVYWESFSQRVRERIISEQKQPFGVKIKELLVSIFTFPPTRLKVAAAVASLVLVFIVGKLYMDYRGTIPERVKYAEEEAPPAETLQFEEAKPTPAPKQPPPKREKKGALKRRGPEGEKQVAEEKVEKPVPPIEPESKEAVAGAGAELMAKKAAPRDIGEKASVLEVMEQEMAKPAEKAEGRRAAMRTMADVEDKKAKPESKVEIECFIDKIPLQEKMAPQEMCEYWFADSIRIPDIDYFGSKLSADSIRVIIDFWSEFIKENPEDIFVESAYLQIAASYYYLFDKTKDEFIKEEGIKTIEEFLKMSKEEETRKSLKHRLEKLKGSKEK